MSKNQKDPTFLGVTSALFLGVLTLAFTVFEDPPKYVVAALIIAILLFGSLFIFALIDYFSKPKLKDLPLAIRNSDIVINGYEGAETLPVSWVFEHTLDGAKALTVEYKHKSSNDGVNFRDSGAVFGTLQISGVGAQKNEVIKCVRNNWARLGNSTPLQQIILSLADNHTLGRAGNVIENSRIRNDMRNKFHIIHVIFSLKGFNPVKKSLWVDRRGYTYNSKPESWPDENSNQP